MPFFTLRFTGAIVIAALFYSLLAGCAAKNTYVDATEPDAAKLRFVANAPNARLYYLDDQRCEGATGELNNLYVPDTLRRAGMFIPPPAKARGYLEIKVKPGIEGYIHVATSGQNWLCMTHLSLIPVANAEYEVTLNMHDNKCITQLSRLQRIDGKDLRAPMPTLEYRTPECLRVEASKSPAK